MVFDAILAFNPTRHLRAARSRLQSFIGSPGLDGFSCPRRPRSIRQTDPLRQVVEQIAWWMMWMAGALQLQPVCLHKGDPCLHERQPLFLPVQHLGSRQNLVLYPSRSFCHGAWRLPEDTIIGSEIDVQQHILSCW